MCGWGVDQDELPWKRRPCLLLPHPTLGSPRLPPPPHPSPHSLPTHPPLLLCPTPPCRPQVPRDFGDYYSVIRKPRCLEQVERSLAAGRYATPLELLADVQLVWDNCRQVGGAGCGRVGCVCVIDCV